MIKHHRQINETLIDPLKNPLTSTTHAWTILGHVGLKVNHQESKVFRLFAVTFFESIQFVIMGNMMKGEHVQFYFAFGFIECAFAVSLHHKWWR